MAQARELLKRIRSIESTRKITRTMELVATSKLKKAQDRIQATVPYAEKLNEMMESLSSVPQEKRSSLMGERGQVKRTALMLITANRGLCGAYNTNLIRTANNFLEHEKAEGREVDFYVSGKKGFTYYRFRGAEMKETYTHFSDVVSFTDVDELTERFIRQLENDEIQRFAMIFCHFESAGRQYPTCWQILPIDGTQDSEEASPEGEGGSKGVAATDFIFEPDAVTILEEIVPLSVKVKVLRALVEAQASEQSARRVAMKVATDNAGEIISGLRRTYNKARQAAITQELAEIMGGVEALKG